MKKNRELLIRQANLSDIPKILQIEIAAWGDELAATEEMYKSRIITFPQGVLVSEDGGKITGVVVTQLVDYDINSFNLSWYEATDNGYIIKTHKPNGQTVYGVNLSVSPDARRGTGTALLESIGKLAIILNLKQGMLGGRIPDYYKYKNIPVEEYIKKILVVNNQRRLLDKELNFYKNAGLRIIRALPNYMKDPESLNYGVLLVWENPFYKISHYLPFLDKLLSKLFRFK